jgi:hypothetical protein
MVPKHGLQFIREVVLCTRYNLAREVRMAQVHVNENDWKKLSKEDQERITGIMRATGLIKHSDHFVGAAAPPARPARFAEANPACVLGCNAAEAAAVAACQLIPAPGNVICVAIAHAAADYCRGQC